jgi:hypothetical protein
METAVERKEAAIKEMKKTGLDYSFVVPEKSQMADSKYESWTNGADSLRLTTIKLIEQAIEDNEDCLWIWEDDSVIDELSFTRFKEELDLGLDFDFIHLNYSMGKLFSMRNIGMLRKTIDGVECCQSYIIHSGVFEEYLEGLKVSRPIDLTTRLLHRKRKNSYVVEPAPVSHTIGKYSYIRDKIVKY